MSKHRAIQAGVLGLPFIGAFAVFQVLPTEPCQVLHYGDYMNNAGEIEFCSDEETTFFDMSQVQYPVHLKLTPVSTPKNTLEVGEETTFILNLADFSGNPISFDDLAVNHERRLHLMAVDPSLEDYRHIHPEPTGAPGEYTFAMTPLRSGEYRVYLDFIPLRSGRRVLAKTTFQVSGTEKPALHTPPEDLRYNLKVTPRKVRTGEPVEMQLSVSRANGEPIHFEPVMGAYAHLVAFDADGKGFAHLHPLNPVIETQDPDHPDLAFTFNSDHADNYRVWAQIKLNGKEIFLPFDLNVEG